MLHASSTANSLNAKPRRIDVHHHFTPPGYADVTEGAVRPAAAAWTVERTLDDMERGGVTTAIHSSPGAFRGNQEQVRRLVRASNEFAAKLSADHPGRFGSFASMPMPDIEGCLEEIEYAMDVLKADGMYMCTSYGNKWLGDPAFAPVYEELNRRKAVIFVHPVAPDCCKGLIPGLRPSAIEYGTDTTRAIARMVFGGTSKRYPDMRMIWSHAGGTMPFLIERFINVGERAIPAGAAGRVHAGGAEILLRHRAGHP